MHFVVHVLPNIVFVKNYYKNILLRFSMFSFFHVLVEGPTILQILTLLVEQKTFSSILFLNLNLSLNIFLSMHHLLFKINLYLNNDNK